MKEICGFNNCRSRDRHRESFNLAQKVDVAETKRVFRETYPFVKDTMASLCGIGRSGLMLDEAQPHEIIRRMLKNRDQQKKKVAEICCNKHKLACGRYAYP